ncbi:tetratricopeptide repeat protein [Psychromonas antarctica]|uniref:tetratricopeptide repeat protein n=1 Tax=Psychromonas antarctica TaxID=67573 RepID=UPI001EE87724|nr:GGDEF domain-containing protein [Psychromonas antarctica]MCG6201265.1 GGDEF domain-containing protein [Psychromonas antarctica]
MKNIGLYLRPIVVIFFLQISLSAQAIVLIDAKVPTTLKQAYDLRYSDPQSCVETTSQYINQQRSFKLNAKGIIEERQPVGAAYAFPAQLQAFCYTQLEDYPSALNLLLPLLEATDLSSDKVRTLNLIASEIPEEERPQLSNLSLLKTLAEASKRITQAPFTDSPNLENALLLTSSKLSLQVYHYSDALSALETVKENIKGSQNKELRAWLVYYYGLYYEQINQQQLAASSFLLANKLANQHAFINLSGQVKSSIADLYQKKYRFSTALDVTKQRIELYLATENKTKQAKSLIQFAILKRQNNENNQALVYLFNALELIEHNKHGSLLAHVYLEIGRTYLANKDEKSDKKELQLAQKYLQNARFHFTRLNKPRYLMESLLLLAQLNMINKDYALAILQLQKVLQISANDNLYLRVQAFEMLASSYERTGNLERAIVNFKNFNALQNRIKEHLFELQQLQISEQLQLFEKTQQQDQLETQNTQLQKKTDHLKTLTYSVLSFLTLLSLILFYTLKRNKKLLVADQQAQQQLAVHMRTKLPLQSAASNGFNTIYHGEPLYYALVSIPYLSHINELVGIDNSAEIEKQLGLALKVYCAQRIELFQIRDNQILFISKQEEQQNAARFAKEIEQFFSTFSEKQQLVTPISCGIVAFPFLNNASRAITPSRILNLSSLALFAASQIRDAKQQSSWVELYAIDNLQPAFFDGDLWILGQAAIDKGLVKIKSSHADHIFNWPKHNK